MSDEQNVDFLEVAHDALGSLFGRILSYVITFLIGCTVVAFFSTGPYTDYSEAFALVFASVLISVITLQGLIILPSLLLVAIAYVKYEWSHWALAFPFLAPWILKSALL